MSNMAFSLCKEQNSPLFIKGLTATEPKASATYELQQSTNNIFVS